jgi:hypothetical protein
METIECKAKIGKRKQNLIFFLISDEDIKSLGDKCIHGLFERGQIVLAHADNRNDIHDMIKEMEG